jgi:hypothetical protein
MLFLGFVKSLDGKAESRKGRDLPLIALKCTHPLAQIEDYISSIANWTVPPRYFGTAKDECRPERLNRDV